MPRIVTIERQTNAVNSAIKDYQRDIQKTDDPGMRKYYTFQIESLTAALHILHLVGSLADLIASVEHEPHVTDPVQHPK